MSQDAITDALELVSYSKEVEQLERKITRLYFICAILAAVILLSNLVWLVSYIT